jgi:F-type H+-transporting ATPase subunit gamma
MPNLLDIKARISSIINTQKITRAMKMVAAAKVKKSENRVKAARPFSRALAEAFVKVLSGTDEFLAASVNVERALDNYPVLMRKRDVKSIGILVVTSNKGLAGAYNANVVRFTLRKIQEYKKQGLDVKLFVVGQKGALSLKRKAEIDGFEILKQYTKIADPSSSNALVIAEDIAQTYVDGAIDSIEIVTTRFKNMMSYSVEDWQILPVSDVEDALIDTEKERIDNVVDPLMIFEPGADQILQKIVPMYITNIIYQALLEAVASELAARMTAMSSATNNADEMIRTLTIDYNKVRQAAITQEISEVVSGADALKN